jgi:hypothetical protein
MHPLNVVICGKIVFEQSAILCFAIGYVFWNHQLSQFYFNLHFPSDGTLVGVLIFYLTLPSRNKIKINCFVHFPAFSRYAVT